MKKSFIILAAAFSIAACNKGLNKTEDLPETFLNETVPVNVQIMNMATKAESADPEEQINSIKVVLYRVNGNVKTYESFYEFQPEAREGTIYIDPSKDADSYYVAAYANVENLSPVTYNEDWTRFSEENPGDFQMYGYFSDTKDNILRDGRVTIRLYRQCSKITVEQVTLDWINSANAHKAFKVKSMFLMDVPGVFENIHKAGFNLNDKALWYNANGKDNNNGKEALLYSTATDIAVTEESPYETDHVLYGYISDMAKADNTTGWNPTGTSLVIEADFDGKTCYYAVRINRKDETEIRNKHFVFKNITITKPGAEAPYEALVEEESIAVTISVEPWTTVTYDNVVVE